MTITTFMFKLVASHMDQSIIKEAERCDTYMERVANIWKL